MIRVTVWNEFRHEKSSPKVAAIYPNGMHETIAEFLRKQPDFEVRTATLDEPEHGWEDAEAAIDRAILKFGPKAVQRARLTTAGRGPRLAG